MSYQAAGDCKNYLSVSMNTLSHNLYLSNLHNLGTEDYIPPPPIYKTGIKVSARGTMDYMTTMQESRTNMILNKNAKG
jgi:hypothetical protein